MHTTRLMDRYSTLAAQAVEPRPRVGRQLRAAVRESVAAPAVPATPRLQSLALTAEDRRKLGLVGPGTPLPVAKNGVDATAAGALRTQWMEVTPELAARWLKNNFRNRPVKEETVTAYARDMAAGRWLRTHQGVAFNDADELIDGQHRLLAIVKCGKAVTLMVTFGLPAKTEGDEMTTMDAVDRGATRSVADQLTIQHGLKDGSLIAMVTRSIAMICSSERTRKLSVGQTLDIFRAFEPAVLFVIKHRSRQPGLKSAGVMAGFAFAITGSPLSAMRIERFFRQLVSGEEIESLPALAKLRDFLTSDEAVLLNRTHDRALAELTLQALHVQLDGRPASEVAVVPRGAEHFRALQPERVAKIAKLFRLPEAKA